MSAGAAGAAGARPRLLLVTTNPGKRAEIAAILGDLGIEFATPAEPLDLGPETGATFAENAVLKARAAASASGTFALADDSGLVVDALGGRPGVLSARFAGPDATDAENNAKLLALMAGVAPAARSARFACAVACAAPGGDVVLGAGECRGRIAAAPRGTCGFGYDPLFEVEGLGLTMAELERAQKNALSHRARALRDLKPKLAGILAPAARGAGEGARI